MITKNLKPKLPQTIDKYMGPQLKKAMGLTMAEFRKSGNNLYFALQPLTDIHLKSDFGYDLSNSGDIKYVYIFGAVAIIMLTIACINFMNLSTAGASKRAREVGVRKVMGSEKKELVLQFLLESVLLTSIALVLATIFGFLALPLFNELSGKDLSLQLNAIPRFNSKPFVIWSVSWNSCRHLSCIFLIVVQASFDFKGKIHCR